MNDLPQLHGLPIVILVVISATVLTLILVASSIASSLMLDDGYYYMQIAWHISQGHGPTFDGINLTNGFHPLWQFMLVPLFWLGIGKEVALHFAAGLQTLFFILSGWMLYVLLHRWIGRWLALTAASAWLLNPWLWNKVAVSGMETGVLVACFGATCWLFIEVLAARKSPWVLGIALAVLAAARIDSVPFSLAIVFLLGSRRMYRAAVTAASPLLFYLATYLIVNIVVFGHPFPVSGYIKSSRGLELLDKFLSSGDVEFLVHGWRNLFNFATLDALLPWYAPIIVPVVVVVCGWLLRGDQRAMFTATLLYAVGLFAYYALMYSSLVMMYTYYFIPLLYLGVICVFLCVGRAKRFWVHSSTVLAAAIVTVVFLAVYLPSRLRLADIAQPPDTNPKYATIEMINKGLPDNAIVGCWDAGEIGYRANKPVVNLDGLANSYEYQEFLGMGALASYLDKIGVTHLMNHDIARRRLIEETLHWDLVYETAGMVSPLATPFSRAPDVQPHKQAHMVTHYIFRRPGKP